MVLRSDDSNYQNQIISKHYTDRKDKSMEQNLRLKAAIIEVVETQLDLNDPPKFSRPSTASFPKGMQSTSRRS